MTFQPVNSLLLLVYCYRVKAIFHNLCTVLHCRRLCGLINSPIVKYPLNWSWCAWSADGSVKQWLPNGKLFLLSHKMPWCALLTAVRIQQRSWKTARLFLHCRAISDWMYEKEKTLILSGDFRFRFSAVDGMSIFVLFSVVNGISCSSAFSFTAENEKCFSVGLQYTSQKGLVLRCKVLVLKLRSWSWSWKKSWLHHCDSAANRSYCAAQYGMLWA